MKPCPPPLAHHTLVLHRALLVLRKWTTSVPPLSSYTRSICAVSGEPALAAVGAKSDPGGRKGSPVSPLGVLSQGFHLARAYAPDGSG